MAPLPLRERLAAALRWPCARKTAISEDAASPSTAARDGDGSRGPRGPPISLADLLAAAAPPSAGGVLDCGSGEQ